MIIKYLSLIVLVVIFTIAGYFYGYHVAEKSSFSAKYDDLQLSLTAEVMTYDAIENGNGKLAVPMVLSVISSDFAKMVELYDMGQREQSDYVRCAITRKLRVLKGKGVVFSGEVAAADWGDALAPIEKYLASECPGRPSHADWSEPDKLRKEDQLRSGEAERVNAKTGVGVE